MKNSLHSDLIDFARMWNRYNALNGTSDFNALPSRDSRDIWELSENLEGMAEVFSWSGIVIEGLSAGSGNLMLDYSYGEASASLRFRR